MSTNFQLKLNKVALRCKVDEALNRIENGPVFEWRDFAVRYAVDVPNLLQWIETLEARLEREKSEGTTQAS